MRLTAAAPVSLPDPGGVPLLTVEAARDGDPAPWASVTLPFEAQEDGSWSLTGTDTGASGGGVDVGSFHGDEQAACVFDSTVSATLLVDDLPVATDEQLVMGRCIEFVLVLGAWPLEVSEPCFALQCE